MDPVVAATVAGLAGALAGLAVPVAATRLAVPYGHPPLAACPRCAQPYPGGWRGWLPGRCAHRRWLAPILAAFAAGSLGWALAARPALAVGAFVVAAIAGVLLALIDLAVHRLPDRIVGATGAVALALFIATAAIDGHWDRPVRAVLAGLALGTAYLVLALLPGANLGLGDVKLCVVLGLLLGWLGWPAVLLGAVVPHLINGPVALYLLVTRRAGRRTELALGPALLAGALIAAVVAGPSV